MVTLGFHPQTQKLEPPCKFSTTNRTTGKYCWRTFILWSHGRNSSNRLTETLHCLKQKQYHGTLQYGIHSRIRVTLIGALIRGLLIRITTVSVILISFRVLSENNFSEIITFQRFPSFGSYLSLLYESLYPPTPPPPPQKKKKPFPEIFPAQCVYLPCLSAVGSRIIVELCKQQTQILQGLV